MKIVITGALGHIGSSLIRNIPASLSNVEFVLIDSLLTQRYSSLFELPKQFNYSFIHSDIFEVDYSLILKDCLAVVHLAAITDAERSFERSTEVHNINYKGTKFIAEACANNNVPLIMISTTSVYGKQSGIVDENCTDLKPQSPYAESKLLAEDYLREIGVTIDLKFIILRFGTIYGTSLGMRFHTAVNKFCWQATLREPVSVWETAYEQLRPYLDIADATKLIFFLIEKRLFHQKTYNAVTRNASVRDIVDIISEEIGEVEIKFVKSSIMNQLSYEVTAEKITAKGFEFSGDLSRGIKDTLLQLESIRNQIPFNIQVK